MLRRAKIGLGIAAIGMTAALVPAVAASASVQTVRSVGTVRTLQISPLCKSYKSEAKAQENASGGALEKAMTSGSWPATQKALLSIYNNEGNAEKQVVGLLSSAPGNVKSAANVVFKFEGTLKSIIQKSTSLTQFSGSVTTATENPKVAAALKTLASYFGKLCPGEVPTTTPTT